MTMGIMKQNHAMKLFHSASLAKILRFVNSDVVLELFTLWACAKLARMELQYAQPAFWDQITVFLATTPLWYLSVVFNMNVWCVMMLLAPTVQDQIFVRLVSQDFFWTKMEFALLGVKILNFQRQFPLWSSLHQLVLC